MQTNQLGHNQLRIFFTFLHFLVPGPSADSQVGIWQLEQQQRGCLNSDYWGRAHAL